MPFVVAGELPDDSPLTRQYWKVRGIKGIREVPVVLLGDSVVGAYTHYDQDNGRTVPCMGHESCHLCWAGLGKRYKAYIAALNFNTNETFVLELTEAATRTLQAMLGKLTGLRGLKLGLSRMHTHPNSKLSVKTYGRLDCDKIPPAFDVVSHLERLWGTKRNDAADMPERENYR